MKAEFLEITRQVYTEYQRQTRAEARKEAAKQRKAEIAKLPERHIIPISGKDSAVTALIQTVRRPDLPYEFLFCDTGAELPETYAWLDEVERQTGWEIQRVGRNLEQLIADTDLLPSGNRRFCTEKAKIRPMEKFYGKGKTYVYYGLRADENRVGARPSDTSTPVYPLQEMGIDMRGVWLILNRKGLLPPAFFWPRLYYRVCELLGENWPIIDELREWEQRALFAGRTRNNCYFCFYQRMYEWVWLSEVHPDYFERACRIERTTGRLLQTPFTWNTAGHLDNFVRNRGAAILHRRAKDVVEIIRKRFNKGLFEESGDTELALTSCGLLCGK